MEKITIETLVKRLNSSFQKRIKLNLDFEVKQSDLITIKQELELIEKTINDLQTDLRNIINEKERI